MPSDGGPAFPCEDGSLQPPSTGMSLRDWMAGMALQGLLGNAPHDERAKDYSPSILANVAYRVADAMIVQREQRRPCDG